MRGCGTCTPIACLPCTLPPPFRHDGPWWLTRAAVIAYLLVAVVVPTLVPRSLRVVAKFSSFSVCMLFLLASAISGLALVALAQGSIAQGVRWLPSYEAIGGSPLGALTSVLTVVSGEQATGVKLGLARLCGWGVLCCWTAVWHGVDRCASCLHALFPQAQPCLYAPARSVGAGLHLPVQPAVRTGRQGCGMQFSLPATASCARCPHAVARSAARDEEAWAELDHSIYACSLEFLHPTVHHCRRPIQKSLKDSSLGGMNRVLYVGLAFCAALYGTVAISGERVSSHARFVRFFACTFPIQLGRAWIRARSRQQLRCPEAQVAQHAPAPACLRLAAHFALRRSFPPAPQAMRCLAATRRCAGPPMQCLYKCACCVSACMLL